MSSSLLSLKWNNHRTTFFHVLSAIRKKESYCDVTLACDGKFYPLHKFVLSTCSEYFEEMFERTSCKNPIIVLKDIKCDDLEALLNYMYIGEVNVEQEKLAGLIKAAECLKIKGLAVPDEEPTDNGVSHKRLQRTEDSPRAKRRRRDNSSDIEERIAISNRSKISISKSSSNNQPKNISESDSTETLEQSETVKLLDETENSSINANRQLPSHSKSGILQKKESTPTEVTLDDDNVKSEPVDLENPEASEDNDPHDNKDSLHHELGFDDSMGGDEDYADSVQTQSVEDVVSQVLPGSSGFQANSFPMWEGDGTFESYTSENNSGNNRQMMIPAEVAPFSPTSTDVSDNSTSSDIEEDNQNYFARNYCQTLIEATAESPSTPDLNSDLLLAVPDQCDKCEFSGSAEAMKEHRIEHLSQQEGESVLVKREVTVPKHISPNILQCQFCSFRCISLQELRSHELKHVKLLQKNNPSPSQPK